VGRFSAAKRETGLREKLKETDEVGMARGAEGGRKLYGCKPQEKRGKDMEDARGSEGSLCCVAVA